MLTMSHALNIPDEIYARAQQLAATTNQSVQQVLIDHLRMLSLLPLDEQTELNALRYLSDDALWTIAAEQVSEATNARMQTLMDKNTAGTLTDVEHAELERLVERGERLMVRKAEAAGILIERGHTFSQEDFLRKHE